MHTDRFPGGGVSFSIGAVAPGALGLEGARRIIGLHGCTQEKRERKRQE
jgi:hypothetical protein